jgi:hypothetical protein
MLHQRRSKAGKMRLNGQPAAGLGEKRLLTRTGRIVLILLGALIGLGIGSAVALVVDFPLSPGIGSTVGAACAYLVTRLWI